MKTGKSQKFQKMCGREFGKLNPVTVFQGGGGWKPGHRRREAQEGFLITETLGSMVKDEAQPRQKVLLSGCLKHYDNLGQHIERVFEEE